MAVVEVRFPPLKGERPERFRDEGDVAIHEHEKEQEFGCEGEREWEQETTQGHGDAETRARGGRERIRAGL